MLTNVIVALVIIREHVSTPKEASIVSVWWDGLDHFVKKTLMNAQLLDVRMEEIVGTMMVDSAAHA
jgi:TRAP-type C4-dicarboxylate transport system permease large subunit